MTINARRRNGMLEHFDRNTHERVLVEAPVTYYEDFLGDPTVPERLTSIDVSSAGDTTPIIAADVGNGVLRCPLDVTSEAQESGVTWGDQRSLVLNRGLIIEMRVALQTLPTLLSEAVWGLAGDKNAVADTVAESLWFKADGNGVIVAEYDDGTNTADDVATGITLTAGTFAIFRIDCTDPAACLLYINGAQVAAATTFKMNAVPTLALQPYAHIAKASGAGLGVLDIDYIRIWQKRS